MQWTPRELRHSFVSVLSDAGVPLEEISWLVGHAGTTVAELAYRHQLKPVIQTEDVKAVETVNSLDIFRPGSERLWSRVAHVDLNH